MGGKKESAASQIKGAGVWTDSKIARLAKIPGNHPLGRGLYLHVEDGRATWRFRYTSAVTGKRPWMELGLHGPMALSDAERQRDDFRQLVKEGRDPKSERNRTRANTILKAHRDSYTVRSAVEDYYQKHKDDWRNEKNRKQWRTQVFANLSDELLRTPISWLVDNPEPLDRELCDLRVAKYATFQEVQGRLNRSFAEAVRLKRAQSNPLDGQKRGKRPPQQKQKPFNALSWIELPKFFDKLKDSTAMLTTRLAIEWSVLSGGRPTETRHATWDQIDRQRRIWTISEDQMKAQSSNVNGDHKVHLTDRHLAILDALEDLRGPWPWLFPGPQDRRKKLSENFWRNAFVSMGYFAIATNAQGLDYKTPSVTLHGFRATLKTWAIDRWRYDDRIVEASLAHKESDMERSYNRSDYWPHRVALADEYADWCLRSKMPPTVRLRAQD